MHSQGFTRIIPLFVNIMIKMENEAWQGVERFFNEFVRLINFI